MLIKIWVDEARPLRGRSEVDGAEAAAFAGWLELLGILSGYVGADGTEPAPDIKNGSA